MNRTCVRGRGRGRRSERIPVSRLSSWIADRERKKVSKREDERGCRLNHHHLRHFTTPFSWHGGVSVGRDTPHCSLSPIPVLHQQTHFSEWIHSSSSLLLSFSCQPPSALYDYFIFSPSLPSCSLFRALPHIAIPLVCHGQGKENDRPTSRKSKRGTTVQGELCPDVELKAARSRSPPDGLSKAENSERRREKKEPCWKPKGGDDCSCYFLTFR